jgi:hypothetical protein
MLKKIASQVNQHNNERRSFDQTITEHAFELIENDPGFADRKSTILFHKNGIKGLLELLQVGSLRNFIDQPLYLRNPMEWLQVAQGVLMVLIYIVP